MGINSSTTFSHEGQLLNVLIYEKNGDIFTRLKDTNIVLPGSTGPRQIAFSQNAAYLAVVNSNSPYVFIFKKDGNTFTKISDPEILPPDTASSVAFSPDDTYLAVGHLDSPFITIYKRDGDTFTKLPNPNILPTNFVLELRQLIQF